MKFFASALLGSSLLSAAAALPSVHRLREIPSDAVKLAFDESNGLVHAFNGAGDNLGSLDPSQSSRSVKRAGTCSALSADDAKKIPGWSQVTDQAKANWGSGSYNLATNMDDYSDSPANICTSDNVQQLTIEDSPSCSRSAQSTQGQFAGTDGTVTLSNTYTETTSTQLTVTQSASIGSSVTLSATVGIPEVVDVTAGITTSIDITNTQSTTTSTTKSNALTQTVTMNASAGQTCSLDFDTATCVAHGSGSIDFVASGWVWFKYNDKTQGHYLWALNMNNILPNDSDRTSSISVDAVVNVDTTSNYSGTCA